jgi:hypothetical protein
VEVVVVAAGAGAGVHVLFGVHGELDEGEEELVGALPPPMALMIEVADERIEDSSNRHLPFDGQLNGLVEPFSRPSTVVFASPPNIGSSNIGSLFSIL